MAALESYVQALGQGGRAFHRDVAVGGEALEFRGDFAVVTGSARIGLASEREAGC